MGRWASLSASVALLAFASSNPVSATEVDDVFLEYSFMYINRVIVGPETREPTFLRHNLKVDVGVDNFTFGLIYARTDKSASTMPGAPGHGLMLTAGYYEILAPFASLDVFARIGITDDDRSQPLYTTDTDLRLKLVLSDPDGWGDIGSVIVFPSAYVGTIVNQYGRVQAVGGVGLWWRGLGAYATGYYAFNGVDNPFEPGDAMNHRFASLKNAGMTASVSYQLQVAGVGDFAAEVRKTIPFKNAGNDLLFLFRYGFVWNEHGGAESR